MPQYDIVLTQNTHATGTEYSEKVVNLSKGGLITANASRVPTVHAVGVDGYMLVADSSQATGLRWAVVSGGHTQNTDTGTTAADWTLDNDGYKVHLIAESAQKMKLMNDAAGYADIQAYDGTFNKVTVGSASPSGAYELCHKTYVDGLFAANDAMIFKGTIGTGGTITISAFNALTTYNAGWTYRVIEAGTIRGVACEIGDIVMVIVDRTGSGNVNGDFTVAQTNLDGAVIGPASVTDGYLVLFDGATGKLIKAGTGAPGSMAYANTTDYVPKTLFDAYTMLYADTDNTPAALTIGASTIVGRKSSGGISALTPVEAMNVLFVSAPANNTSAGTAGMIAWDGNYFYLCTYTGTAGNAKWTRTVMSTIWP